MSQLQQDGHRPRLWAEEAFIMPSVYLHVTSSLSAACRRCRARLFCTVCVCVCVSVCVCDYRLLPARLRRSLYGQSLHTLSHSDVWSFCVLLRVWACVFEVCVSVCHLPAVLSSLWFLYPPSLPPSPPSLLLYSTSLPLYASSLHYSSLPLFSLFFLFCLSLLITFYLLPPLPFLLHSITLLSSFFSITLISSYQLSSTFSHLILPLEHSLLFPYIVTVINPFCPYRQIRQLSKLSTLKDTWLARSINSSGHSIINPTP